MRDKGASTMYGATSPIWVRSRALEQLETISATAIAAGAVSRAVLIGLRQTGKLSGSNLAMLAMDAQTAAERETAASNPRLAQLIAQKVQQCLPADH
jgi:hypothetical protein